MQPSVERRDSLEEEPRSGRIPEVVNEENAAAVRSLLIAVTRLTVEELSCATGLSETSVWRMVGDKLGYHKVCAWWVPHLLTTDQKQHRVTLSKALLDMFGPRGSRWLTDIVTGDSVVGLRPMSRTRCGWRKIRNELKCTRIVLHRGRGC